MRIALFSDIHLDHYKEGTKRFLRLMSDWPGFGGTDVAVLAGDISSGMYSDSYRMLFGELLQYCGHVVAVPGNHDFYRCGYERGLRNMRLAAAESPWVHVLDKSSVTIQGRTFVGAPMWFREQPLNICYEHWFPDFKAIPSCRPMVYEQNRLFEQYLKDVLVPGDIVVTHHLPSFSSVPARWKKSETNRFFVCDMEELIAERKPALWLHGHTHEPFDYQLFDTRVMCNPRANPHERLYMGPYAPKYVEV